MFYPLGHQVISICLNDHEDVFQVLFPAPSQKPFFVGKTSPERVHREQGQVQEALSEGIFSRQEQDNRDLSPLGHNWHQLGMVGKAP